MRDSAEGLIERVSAATAPLRIRGGGSKDFYGNAPQGEMLDTREHAGIVAYEPTELFVTARCGTPLAEIEAALAEKGQCLPCEPPRFPPDSAVGGNTGGATVGGNMGGATVGGAVAAGLSGPRRASAGSVRDYVLGVKLVDGRGRVLDFGGQVMKNVAGYDVSRLVAGSLGTLGLILEATLKVLPKPAAEATLRFEMDEAVALERLNAWAGQPLPIVASAWDAGALTLKLAGAQAAVDAAAARLGGEKVGPGETVIWDDLRDQRLAFFAGQDDGRPLWRLSVPSTAPALGLGSTLIEWGGALRWLRSDAPPETVRAAAAHAGGHATLFRATDAAKAAAGGAFAPLPEPLMALHRRLKAAFDPRGVFNPGRLYPGL